MTRHSLSQLLARVRIALRPCFAPRGTKGVARQFNETLRERLANWNPDWEDKSSLAELDAFGRAHPDAVEPALKYICGTPERFGRSLYRALDLRLRTRPLTDDFVDFVKALTPLIEPGQSELSGRFWQALRMDARRLTERRRREARPRALWGVTPINILRTYALADQRCGIEAESLVFTTYYIASDFDVVLSAHQETILALAPHCLVPFRWLVLTWALLRYDVINLYNDRGVIEPAGGYGSPQFGIALAEMDLYRETGKTFFTHAYGADHRTRMKTLALGKWNFCVDCPEPGKFCLCDDAGGERVLCEIASRATGMVSTGLAMDLIPGAHNLYGLPVDVATLVPKRGSGTTERYPASGRPFSQSRVLQGYTAPRSSGRPSPPRRRGHRAGHDRRQAARRNHRGHARGGHPGRSAD